VRVNGLKGLFNSALALGRFAEANRALEAYARLEPNSPEISSARAALDSAIAAANGPPADR
jgi:hypothetical protein